MPEFYFGTDDNKIGAVKTSAKTGKLVRVSMFPSAPNPDKTKSGYPGGISTQWVVKHPTQPLVMALTSYWNKRSARLTCFQAKNGDLTPIGQCDTAGREACHATFYPKSNKDKVTLACAHLHDGTVSFFQFPTKDIPKALDDQPAMTISLPVIKPGTHKTLGTGMGNISIPCSSHVYYDPHGIFLLVVDTLQSYVFTYQVDDTGLPTSQEPSATFRCHTDAPSLGWFRQIVDRFKGFSTCRPRRVAVSPNGQYVFVSYKPRNVVQVYPIDQHGTIDPDGNGCMQEVSTLDESLRSTKIVGLTFQASAEMTVFGDSLFVSNRGDKLLAGRSENSVRIFDIRDGGRLASHYAVQCSGPVRHFCVYESDGYDTLIAGTTRPGMSLEMFRRKQGDKSSRFELVGEAEVGLDIYCVIHTE